MSPVILIAKREFNTRVRNKSFLIGLVVTLVIIAGAIIVPTLIKDDGGTKFAVTGSTTSLSTPLSEAAKKSNVDITVSTVDDAATATAEVKDGKLDAALVARDGGYRIVVKEELKPEVQALVTALVQQQATGAELIRKGVDPAELASVTAAATPKLETLEPVDPQAAARKGMSFLVSILLFMQLILLGSMVATGVIEEKSSRVVEILLSTVRPWQLLSGKVLGIGMAGLVQLVFTGVVGLAAAKYTGSIQLDGDTFGVIGISLLWFLLGFFFYATLYAAGASLVSRQEEIQSVITPINMILMVAYFISVYSVNTSGPGFAGKVAWIPGLSPILMPQQIAAGHASVAMMLLAVAAMLVAIFVAAWIGGKVYQNSVLRFGARISWKAALRSTG
ncbi:ABC transporter permease [Pseudonocardiaceae bacterium YIM PH 21723]|nr:ABC transporter permease [Pseudonocardiaceae bacterium YIM PH 21723]